MVMLMEKLFNIKKLPQPKNYPYFISASSYNHDLWNIYASNSMEKATIHSILRNQQQLLNCKFNGLYWIGIGVNREDSIKNGLLNYLNSTIKFYQDLKAYRIVNWYKNQNETILQYLKLLNGNFKLFLLKHENYPFPYLLGEFTLGKDTIYIPKVLAYDFEETIHLILDDIMTNVYLFFKEKPLFTVRLDATIKEKLNSANDIHTTIYCDKNQWFKFVEKLSKKILINTIYKETFCMAKIQMNRLPEITVPINNHQVKLDNRLLDIMPKNTLSMIYHQNSKIRKIHKTEDYIFAPYKIDRNIFNIIKHGVKDIPISMYSYILPDTSHYTSGKYLENIIKARRSNRSRSSCPISIKDLAHLLQFSYGVTGSIKDKKNKMELPVRAVPSGGGLYPIDLYIYAKNIESIKKGIYYYNPLKHSLHHVSNFQDSDYMKFIGGISKKELDQTSLLIMLVGNFPRNQWKYRERGYRVVHLDCGHLSQNIILNSVNLNMVAKPVMGFVDDYMNEILNLDGVNESVLCLLSISYVYEEIEKRGYAKNGEN